MFSMPNEKPKNYDRVLDAMEAEARAASLAREIVSGWKAIGQIVGVYWKTAKAWSRLPEHARLPVRRYPSGRGVYMVVSEFRAWRDRQPPA